MQTRDDFLKAIHNNQALIHKVCNIYRDRKEDKEDLFQEITYQLWKSFPNFRGDSKFTSWMYRIALNTAMASFRKDSLKISDSDKLPEKPMNEHEENYQERLLFKAIKKLDEGEKAIISLYLEGMTNSEMAEIIGISKNNVSVRLNRIKNKIKSILKLTI